MAIITSRWPGKCRICGIAHSKGDRVSWDPAHKGVKCMQCANNSEPVPRPQPTPIEIEEDDELKKAKPETLKPGHLISSPYYNAYDVFGCSEHSDFCNCPGCIIHRKGIFGEPPIASDNESVSIKNVRIESHLYSWGQTDLFPGASDALKQRHRDNNRQMYDVRYVLGSYSRIEEVQVTMPLPIVYIDSTHGFRILGGAPNPQALDAKSMRVTRKLKEGEPSPNAGAGIPDAPTPSTPVFMEIPAKEANLPTSTLPMGLNEAALSLIAALQGSAVPEAKVREIALEMVKEELKKLPVKNHKIKFNDGEPIPFDGILHGMATEVAEAIVCGFHNIMVVGPAGSGKTYLFSQVATILKEQMKWDPLDYKASMSCAPGQTESMFIGRMIPSLTTGTETYHGTNLTRLYSKPSGGAFLFDEISNSEPTVMNLVNAMIALDGHVTLPDGRVLERPANMVIFAADNTWGQGGDRMYIRNQLDAATLDRFTGAKFFMDYDEKLELALCPLREVYDAVLNLRKKVTDLKLRRIVSTRAFAAAQRMGSNGMSNNKILKRLTIDWSENDRKSVGV